LRLPTLSQFLTVHNGGGNTAAAVAATAAAPVFICPACSRKFSNRTGLSLHQAKSHKIKPDA